MIKRLAGCIRQYKKQTILTPLCMVGEVSLECVLPLVMANLINALQNGCSMPQVLRYGAVLVVMAVGSLCFGVLSGRLCATASAGFACNLRHDLFEKVQSFSFSNIDRFSTSSLVTRLTTDVTNVQTAFMMLIRVAVRSPLMLLFSILMAIQVGGRLTWVFVVIVPILAFGLVLIIRKAYTDIFRRLI